MPNSKESQRQFSKKFYLGVFMLLSSLVIGKITQAAFILYFNDELIRRISIILYLISWPMFLWGIWAVGREYSDKLQRYFKVTYYRDLVTGFFEKKTDAEPVEEKVIEKNE